MVSISNSLSCKYKVTISSNLSQNDCQDTSSPVSCVITRSTVDILQGRDAIEMDLDRLERGPI